MHRSLMKLVMLVALLAAALVLLPAAGPARAQGGAWKAEYYNNKNLSGTPVVSTTVPAIDFYWGYKSPYVGLVNADNFSARWTQTLYAPAGNYRIVARMDDAMRIYVDNQLIIDEWYDSQEHAESRDFYISNAGNHTIRVEYYEATGVAMAVVEWYPLSGGSGSGGSGGGSIYPNWKAEYFANRDLIGSPAVVRDEKQVDFNWVYSSPAPESIPPDNFSARFTRTFRGPAGQYRISLTSDDGARLYLNGVLVVDSWTFTGKPVSVDYFYDGQPMEARVEYYEKDGKARVHLTTAFITSPPTGGGGGGGSGGGLIPPEGGGGGGSGSGSQCPQPGAYQAVANSAVNVRQGPGTEYAITTTVAPCTVLNLTGFRSADSRWVSVSVPGTNKYDGWADASLLTLGTPIQNLSVWGGSGGSGSGGSGSGGAGGGVAGSCPVPSPYQATALARVNIRSGPSTSSPVISTAEQCDVLAMTGYKSSDNQFVQVQVPGVGSLGWVSVDYVTLGTPMGQLSTFGGVG